MNIEHTGGLEKSARAPRIGWMKYGTEKKVVHQTDDKECETNVCVCLPAMTFSAPSIELNADSDIGKNEQFFI